MRWYTALLFNFLSSLTALAGFFIGVSVGLVSEPANSWMLAIAAGTFLYVALVDLVSYGSEVELLYCTQWLDPGCDWPIK